MAKRVKTPYKAGELARVKRVLTKVVKAYGGYEPMRVALKLRTKMALYNWKMPGDRRGIPAKYLADIHEHTGIPLAELRQGVLE